MRTLSTARRDEVRDAMERVIAGVTAAHRATYRFDFEVGYDPVVNDGDGVGGRARAIVAELGEEALVELPPVMGGEDFSAYCSVAPAAFFWVGSGNEELGTTFPHHHPRFDIDEAAPARRDRRVRPDRARRASVAPWPARARPRSSAAERAGIAVHRARVRARSQGASYGLEAAEKLGVDPARVFKTLVADVDGSLTVAIVPVAAQLDLKALGKRAHDGRSEARGAHDRLRRRRDQPARPAQAAADAARRVRARLETIHVSAGRRGLEIELAPADLLALTGGRALPLAARR